MESTRVVIMGGSIAGCMAAAFLKQKHPELEVVVVTPEDPGRPIVGESTVEASVTFMRELGLATHLDEHHVKKHGLTFYYRMPSEPGEEMYSVHESLKAPHTMSRLINRTVIDAELRQLCGSRGVQFVAGRVTDVELSSAGGLHEVAYSTSDGAGRISARYLIDASGRRRILGKKLGITSKRNDRQRSTFWFRLADFDMCEWLKDVRVAKPPKEAYDSYEATHHFMGKGNWVWCIPLRCESGRPLISIGITWRPDVFPDDVRSMDDFLRVVEKEHPSVARFVRSGKVLDEQTYRNFLYSSKQVFSPDRWFVIGDAANAVDPLYSTGLLFTTLALRQVENLIASDLAGAMCPVHVRLLDEYYRGSVDGVQSRITRHYEMMDDPYQSHLIMHWDTLEYAYFFLPLLAGGYHWKKETVARIVASPEFAERERRYDERDALLRAARGAKRRLSLDDMRYLYDRSINYDFDMYTCRTTRLMARGLRTRARLRMDVLRDAGFRGARTHAPAVIKDYLASIAMGLAGDRALG